MPWTDFDDDATPSPVPAHAWNPSGPPPTRDLAAVLADARPVCAGGVYRWHRSGPDWWGVDPPNGVLPREACAAVGVVYGAGHFLTAAGACAVLYCAMTLLREGRIKFKPEGG